MRISDWSSDVCSSDLFPSPSCESSGPQVTEPPVEDQRNRQGNHQQDGDDDFHDHGQCHHMPPRFFRVRSIFTAMLLPMRPMRPSTMDTPPQRISPTAPGVALNMMVFPHSRFITLPSVITVRP